MSKQKTPTALTPEELSEAVEIFKTLKEAKLDFEDYMQREYDQGKARGFEEGIAIASQFVMDRAAELWKNAHEHDPLISKQAEASTMRNLAREMSALKGGLSKKA